MWMGKHDWLLPTEHELRGTILPLFREPTDGETAHVTLLWVARTNEGGGDIFRLYRQDWKVEGGLWSGDPGPLESPVISVDVVDVDASPVRAERSASGGHIVYFELGESG